VTTLVALFGVVLPAFTLGFELTLRWCSTELFDPVPTLVHRVLVGVVPVANLLALDGRGGHWTDVSAWYWSALLGSSEGPWWALTVAENAQP